MVRHDGSHAATVPPEVTPTAGIADCETSAVVRLQADCMKPIRRSALIRTFATLRLATGLAAWLAPKKTGRLIGLNARPRPAVYRLTLALAITDPTPRLQTRALQLGLLTDGLDVVAAARGIRARTLSTTGAVVTGGGAALFAGLGLAALNGRERPSDPRRRATLG